MDAVPWWMQNAFLTKSELFQSIARLHRQQFTCHWKRIWFFFHKGSFLLEMIVWMNGSLWWMDCWDDECQRWKSFGRIFFCEGDESFNCCYCCCCCCCCCVVVVVAVVVVTCGFRHMLVSMSAFICESMETK